MPFNDFFLLCSVLCVGSLQHTASNEQRAASERLAASLRKKWKTWYQMNEQETARVTSFQVLPGNNNSNTTYGDITSYDEAKRQGAATATWA